MLVYPHISLVKAIWVKGSKFTLTELLKSPTRAKKYKDCALVLCRLAPQDYHRFHFPMAGKYTNTKHISGHYYSVKPSLVKSNYNVFTENKRTVTYLRTQFFKDIAIIAVGATCVGSIVITAKSNSKVKKGQEYGTFAFGGSSIIMLIPKGLINFDKDLTKQSKKGVETLVRMGQRIGTH
jgi:phosphatidylserine decarboxylase